MYDLVVYSLTSFSLLIIWIAISPRKYNSFYLSIYHILIGGLFLYFSINNPADSQEFFLEGSTSSCLFGNNLNQLEFASKLKFDLTNPHLILCATGSLKGIYNNFGFVSSIFTFLGFLGLNYFFQKILTLTKKYKFDNKLSLIIFYLPTISFWTSGISKESLMIFAYSLIFNFILDSRLNFDNIHQTLKFLTGVLIILLVRPYSLIFILFSFFISQTTYMLDVIKTLKIERKTLIILLFSLIIIKPAITIFGRVISVNELNNLNYELISQRINISRISAMESGGSFITQKGFDKTLLILFGPFSFQSIYYVLESITGIAVVLLFSRIIFYLSSFKIKILKNYYVFLISIFALEIFKFQFAVFNLGIIVRQRTFIIIYMLLFLSLIIMRISRQKNLVFK